MKYWKRFAFFERNNLTLPPAVLEDVLPSHLFADDPDSPRNNNNSNNNNNNNASKNSVELKGDRISLAVVNGAGVPIASITESLDPSLGVNGMIHTLSASSTYGHQTKDDKATKASVEMDGSGAAKEMFQFSGSGQTLSIPQSAQKNGNVNGSLVLAFLSSKAAHHVHCLDLTVRCNPLHRSSLGGSGSGSGSGKGGSSSGGLMVTTPKPASLSMVGKTNEQDLDGWRGYFQPFAYDVVPDSSHADGTDATAIESSPNPNVSGTVNTGSGGGAKIRAIAVSSDHEKDIITLGQNIYVACITEDPHSIGVTVHRNPHLYLNDMDALRNSRQSPDESAAAAVGVRNVIVSPRRTPKVECFQPLSKFDHKHRGKPLCVDVAVGIAAVGTDNGMIVLYTFPTSSTKNAPMGGCNGTNKLTMWMEIPPPHASSLSLKEQGSGGRGQVQMQAQGAARRSVIGGSSGAASAAARSNASADPSYAVSSVNMVLDKASNGTNKNLKLFVTYRGGAGVGGGVCCYDLGIVPIGVATTAANSSIKSSPSTISTSPHARYDLDGREVASDCLCDVVVTRRDKDSVEGDVSMDATTDVSVDASSHMQGHLGSTAGGSDTTIAKLMIARADGLYTYSSTDKISVSPIDGSKIAMCAVPPPPVSRRQYHPHRLLGSQSESSSSGEAKRNHENDEIMTKIRTSAESGASYVLIATTDLKSGRDAVDIYDASNKLVAFHILLSPGHRALGAVGVTTTPKAVMDGNKRGGLSSAVIFTSGGSIVTLTEKVTSDKVSLLVQKNLYAAAISMAFADPTYQPADITALFRKHAEHLYRKGDFSASMDQYIYTIGSLEPSYVIFRFLDAPKIPLLTKYLEELRSRDIATSVHCELLRTCYLKLNDVNMAEKISASLSKSMTSTTCNSLVSSLLHNPVEALATICSFDAPHAVEALKSHGSTLAKALPKETAGVVIMLCDGVYTPTSIGAAGSSGRRRDALEESLESSDRPTTCDMYPVHLFSSAFLENPKLLRVILAHCDKNKRGLNSSLKRMLLELTLEEWNAAKRTGDFEREDIRRGEAMAMLSEPGASEDIGDYEALVVVQQQDFVEGMIMLYEKLQLAPMLMEKYAEDGSYKARRQMLAMCRSDPELLADVLGYFVSMAGDLMVGEDEDKSINSESDVEELLDDIREALSMARSQAVLPPVRVARILAGDGIGQFTEERKGDSEENDKGLPLSVALDYIGAVMDEQSSEIDRLKSNIEEYNALCNDMESEINDLLSLEKVDQSHHPHGINIDEMYSKLIESPPDNSGEKKSEMASEEFWRQMEHSSDRFETLARFFAKDILE